MISNFEARFYEDREGEKISILGGNILWGSFRNFDGLHDKFGGDKRFFNVEIPEEFIPMFEDHEVKVNNWTTTNDKGETRTTSFVKVLISYNYSQPQIEVKLKADDEESVSYTENMVKDLQTAEFDDTGLILRISRGVSMGRPYASLYLRNGFFVLKPDEDPYVQNMYNIFGRPSAPAVYDDEEETPF